MGNGSKPTIADSSNIVKGETVEGWQAKKSAMTRTKILEATISCFVSMGFANVTTGSVIQQAGISRGTMLHHFPSKTELIRASVEYLQAKLLDEYSSCVARIPESLRGADRRREGLREYWNYLTGDLAATYHEICIAAQREPELQDIVEASLTRFGRHTHEKNRELFSEWFDDNETYLLAMDTTQFLLQGMAFGQLKHDREKRVERMLDFLHDRLEGIFAESLAKRGLTARD